MKTFILIFLTSLLIVSCDSEDVSYNPELEGSYLCEAVVKTPGGYWSCDVEDMWCPVGMTGFVDPSEQFLESILNVSFSSPSIFSIGNFYDSEQINLFSDMSVESDYEYTMISGSFYGEDSLKLHVTTVKAAYEAYGISSSFGQVTDDYYCVKQ